MVCDTFCGKQLENDVWIIFSEIRKTLNPLWIKRFLCGWIPDGYVFANATSFQDINLIKYTIDFQRDMDELNIIVSVYPDPDEISKTKKSVRTVILPRALVEILILCVQSSGFVCSGEQPWTWTVMDNIKQRAYKKLQIKGFSNYDFRSTYGTQLKESGISSAIVADLMGHADTRMVETVYARTRHEGVMKQFEAVEAINAVL